MIDYFLLWMIIFILISDIPLFIRRYCIHLLQYFCFSNLFWFGKIFRSFLKKIFTIFHDNILVIPNNQHILNPIRNLRSNVRAFKSCVTEINSTIVMLVPYDPPYRLVHGSHSLLHVPFWSSILYLWIARTYRVNVFLLAFYFFICGRGIGYPN